MCQRNLELSVDFSQTVPDLMNGCGVTAIPREISRSEAFFRGPPVRPWTRSSDAQALYKRVWRLLIMDGSGRHASTYIGNSPIVVSYNGHSHLSTQLVHPSQDMTQNLKVVSLPWYLPGTRQIGVSAALGVRVYSQTPTGVHQAFQNAHGPQNTAHNRHPARLGITIRIEVASTTTSKSRCLALPSSAASRPCGTGASSLCFVSLKQRGTMKC
ncbi:hypothetical protein BJY52DRAFT_76702 [Lactarius psammicola]|nr:hypothetical protein BJY52DRAFT_76702 [Lactarius psammicola]